MNHGARAARASPEQLDGDGRGRALHGETRQVTLADLAASHLVARPSRRNSLSHWLEVTRNPRPGRSTFSVPERDLASITVGDVRRGQPPPRGHPPVEGDDVASSVRHHLSCLSNLYKRARAERVVPQVTIRWATSTRSPSPARGEAKWLDP